MALAVLFRPEAGSEVLSARQWYEAQAPGLGARFVQALEDTIKAIASDPAIFQRAHGEMRRAFIRRFPYAVYFRLHGDTVIVLSVMHGHRDPRRWRSRQ